VQKSSNNSTLESLSGAVSSVALSDTGQNMKIEPNDLQVRRPFAWRTPIAAAALALAMGLVSTDASALALGRVNVLSSLGEPLRAEIDIPEINAEEAASLRVNVAAPDAFRAAGLEYNAALTAVQVSLQRRGNGRPYLLVTSPRSVNEPFVDLIIEANWASGRIVRDYTMLFDPSNLRAQPAAPATAPITGAPAPSATRSAAPRAATPSASPAPRAAAPARAPREPAPKAAAAPAPSDGVRVRSGDTAAALAARYKPEGVSLDQMLVAMLRSSPDAFIGGNVNRLRAGSVIDVQSAASSAPGTSAPEARQTIVAQSRDFNEFRRRLASGTTMAAAPAGSRAAGGRVQTQVTDSKPQAAAPDKLTLSKGAVAAKKEESIAKDKQAQDAATRVAELSKNISDLGKIGTTTTATAGAAKSAASAPAVGVAVKAPAAASPASAPAAPAPAAAPAAPATTAPASAPAVTPVVTPTVASVTPTTPTVPAVATSTAASSDTATQTTTAAAPAPAVEPPKPPVAVAPPPPPPEPSFIEGLMDNPLTLPAAGGLLAVLAGLGIWRFRQSKKTATVDSSFLESRLQPDSFFGASGGQRVDTAESASGAGSSMVYSPSQLDAAGDVDPVAEADVYLAYGRDLQAEEILKEAMRTNPQRVAIHVKLLEIYAKRRDAKAFEVVAKEAYTATGGDGPEWDTICALGRDVDSGNPLYQSSGAGLGTAAIAAAGAAAGFATNTLPQQVQPLAPNAQADNVDFDLDLDFSGNALSDGSSASSAILDTPAANETTSAMKAVEMRDSQPVDLDFDAPDLNINPAADASKLSAPDLASFASGLSFSSDDKTSMVTPMATQPMATQPMTVATSPTPPESNSLEFDLGNLSLDLPGKAPAAGAMAAIDAGVSGDPLETKLALALEFKDIGDLDGARALAQEVAEEATGALKAKAQRMVADFS
jgi:pilus assembly protein FimV